MQRRDRTRRGTGQVPHRLTLALIDGGIVKFYAEAEDILTHLPKLGIPMIMRRIEKGECKGDAKV
jgi:hypothetical protein